MSKDLFLETFKKAMLSSMVKCEICGYEDYSLVRHLREAHNMSQTAYKKQYPNASLKSLLVEALETRLDRHVVQDEGENGGVEGVLQQEGVNTDEIYAKGNESQELKRNRLLGEFEWPDYSTNYSEGDAVFIPESMEGYEFDMDLVKQVIASMEMGFHLYIEGPVGCGKTELVKQICAKAKKPMLSVNAHGDLTVNNYLGHMKVRVGDGGQGTEMYFMEGVLLRALRMGAMLVIDEIDFMAPNISALMHSVMDERKGVYVSELNEFVKAKEGFMVVGIGNTGGRGDFDGRYIGAEAQNIAFLDRFQFRMKMDYMKQSMEMVLVKTLDTAELKKLMSLVKEAREAFKGGVLTQSISTRKVLNYAKMREYGFRVERALEYSMFNGLAKEEEDTLKEVVKRVGLKSA